MASTTVSTTPSLETVESVDLQRYVGLWYEIAKIPNRFQDQCVANTTAEYGLREDGKISVTNRCETANGDMDTATGVAKVVDSETNAKLKVSFVRFLWRNWFWGDYWIIGLDEEYEWAVIGTPSRKYGWILSRTPEMSEEDLNRCYEILTEQGYDPVNFESTPQE